MNVTARGRERGQMTRWRHTHYEQTANHWLANMDSRKEVIIPVLKRTYGKKDAAV